MEDEHVTTEQILAELDEYLKPLPPVPEGAITVQNMMDWYGISYTSASRQLRKMVKEGRMKKLNCKSEAGRRCFAYVKVRND